jgi:hypothetical protein
MTKWILAAVLALVTTGASARYLGTGSNPNSHPVQGPCDQLGYLRPAAPADQSQQHYA